MDVDHFGDIILAEPIIKHRSNAHRCTGIIIHLHSNGNILTGPWEWICLHTMNVESSSANHRRSLTYLYFGNCHVEIGIWLHAKRPNRPVHCSIAVCKRNQNYTGNENIVFLFVSLTTVAIRLAGSNPCNWPDAIMLRFSLCTSSINCLSASVKCNNPPV